MTHQDTFKGVFITGNFTEGTIQPMLDKGDCLYSYPTKMPIAEIGIYHFLLALVGSIRETGLSDCAEPSDISSLQHTIGTTGAPFSPTIDVVFLLIIQKRLLNPSSM